MKIETIEVFVYKYNHHYKVGGHDNAPDRIFDTDYYFEPKWKHVYSRITESCLVKITTDNGIIGWGEAQSPIVPEVVATLIGRLSGPAIIGLDAENTDSIFDRLYHLNHARGHTTSFTIDAITALDIALWDIKGKAKGKPVNKLLNKKVVKELPLYVSGLRRPDLKDKIELAKRVVSEGYKGIKIFSGESPEKFSKEFPAIRSEISKNTALAFDAINKYSYKDALVIGKMLDESGAAWFESPLHPGDINGHAKLSRTIKTPIAGGEMFRTVYEFSHWINKKAFEIAQPDIVRCGITGGNHIVSFLKENDTRVAFHVGVCTAIGVAATWHYASAHPFTQLQEHQLEMFGVANKILKTPLKVIQGRGIIPTANGLGIVVDEKIVRKHASEGWLINKKGSKHIRKYEN